MTNTANLKPESVDHIAKVSGRYARLAKLNALMSDVVSDILDPSTVTNDALIEVQAAWRDSTRMIAPGLHGSLNRARTAFAEALLAAFDAWAASTGVEIDFDDRMWMLTSIFADFGFPPEVALAFSHPSSVRPS